MNEETYNKIKKWIFDNHEHHHMEDDHDDNSSKCSEGNYPYVNSLFLEKFIDDIGFKK